MLNIQNLSKTYGNGIQALAGHVQLAGLGQLGQIIFEA